MKSCGEPVRMSRLHGAVLSTTGKVSFLPPGLVSYDGVCATNRSPREAPGGPMNPVQPDFVSIPGQAVGVLIVAGLLRSLAPLVPGGALGYWWVGLVGLGVSELSLFAAPHAPAARVPLLATYCLAQYLFGFLLWAGCRSLATGGAPLRRRHWALLAPLAVSAAVLPVAVPTVSALLPFHAVFVGGLYLFALRSLRGYRPPPGGPTAGLRLLRASMWLLVLLFWHYPLAIGYSTYFDPDQVLPYIAFWSLYDLLLQTGLAFGMIVFASDRVRERLEERNRQLAAASEELSRAARTDPLTGLLNRRALDDLEREMAGRPFAGSLGVIDLNDLKPLNDRHGHAAGDAALQSVARALRNLFRVTDPIFRTGGDEFLVILPDGSESYLAARLARLDAALTGTRLSGVEGPVNVRVAWGVTEFGSAAELRAAFRRADAAMYRCKSVTKQSARNSESQSPPGGVITPVRSASISG